MRFRILFALKTKLFVCKIHTFWVIKSYRLLSTDLSVVRSVQDLNEFQEQIFQKASKFLPDVTSNNQENLNIRQQCSDSLNLQAPCVLYVGQAFRYSPENAFYIFNQQISDNEIYLLIKYIKSVLWRVAKRLSLYRGRTVPKG